MQFQKPSQKDVLNWLKLPNNCRKKEISFIKKMGTPCENNDCDSACKILFRKFGSDELKRVERKIISSRSYIITLVFIFNVFGQVPVFNHSIPYLIYKIKSTCCTRASIYSEKYENFQNLR